MALVQGTVARLIKGELADENVTLQVRIPCSDCPSRAAASASLQHDTFVSFQVTDLHPAKGGKYTCKLGDGCQTLEAIATKQVSQIISKGDIQNGHIVGVNSHTFNDFAGVKKMIWAECKVRRASLEERLSNGDSCRNAIFCCVLKSFSSK